MLDEKSIATTGELSISDLPPIQELTITVPRSSLVQVGKVLSIVGVLVVIESIKSMPPLDLDSVLFDSNGSPLGQIFDVFGPITEPHYSIRYNNNEQIIVKNVQKDMPVYFLPENNRSITKFAFLDEIRKHKGTDASTEHDNEAPHNDSDSD